MTPDSQERTVCGTLLVCAATRKELLAFRRGDETWNEAEQGLVWTLEGLTLAVTGVGIPVTLMRLPAILQRYEPAAVLNIGIAGAYPNSGLSIGDLVSIHSETFGDIGFELPDEPHFTSITESPFGQSYDGRGLAGDARFDAAPPGFAIRSAAGCTVNTCTGTAATGLLRERISGAEVESMEGVAVALAAEAAGLPVCEIRAISNIAAKRHMTPANIDHALVRLHAYLAACRDREGI